MATGAKDSAREHVVEVLAQQPENPLAIRVNQIGTACCHRDVLDIVRAATNEVTLVVPKVESAADVGFIDRLIRGAGAELPSTTDNVPAVRIDVLLESAAALRDLDAILGASPLLRAAVIGYADLSADLAMPSVGETSLWDAVRSQVATAARAHGRALIDGPWLSTAADEAFTHDRSRARSLGFDGTWVIHPAQLDEATRIFTPSAEEVAWASRIVETLADAVAQGAGAVALDGQMLDEAVAVRARSVLVRAGVEWAEVTR
ncbi:citrate lyase subunit beta/citryl-CoA lyase [Nocardioides daedukensis]|uniref:Citrate lyase subunit beta/citryl-CoA lyase n=1 Tax=Nocardioides daedukensis TaxID=634462 RepID=A0A7Y9UNI8_9ACTN|nr:aldolase/citrate lyase family protein [Nocardioides daedukensis]NYG57207.1 citrate lyase subunit beta/citryl-CoA lyase [Nocardioides daedukensis]